MCLTPKGGQMRRLGGLVLIMTLMGGVSSATAEEQTLSFGRLGTVTLYRQSPHPSHVILFVSGDGGWNRGCRARNWPIPLVPFLRTFSSPPMLPKVGHGFSAPRNWLPQLKQVFSGLTDRQTAEQRPMNLDLKDLPLVERPAGGEPRPLLAVLVTGDGGWAGIDQEIASALVAAGVGVVGLNSLKYFWTPRTPESASRDLGRILTHYLASGKKPRHCWSAIPGAPMCSPSCCPACRKILATGPRAGPVGTGQGCHL